MIVIDWGVLSGNARSSNPSSSPSTATELLIWASMWPRNGLARIASCSIVGNSSGVGSVLGGAIVVEATMVSVVVVVTDTDVTVVVTAGEVVSTIEVD